ncbi:MAG: glutaredoxin family protein [Candidatus Colwellbacteria bacterium]|nr:glutaredoxin family protein [Candidatus Colwellbacteria bacterium]
MPVIIYTTPTCVYCRMAADYFAKKGVGFTKVDVSSDEGAAREMVRKSHQMGVPVIEIGGEVIVGFNRPEIDRALKENGLLR